MEEDDDDADDAADDDDGDVGDQNEKCAGQVLTRSKLTNWDQQSAISARTSHHH